jgi:Fe-S cluster assembly ATP-binding protein
MLEIKELEVNVEGKKILDKINLKIEKDEIVALMGPNGSGKSTLAYALMGHPKYEIVGGKIILDGNDITEMPPNERAQLGLFLAFQYPQAVPGVSVSNFLRTAVNAQRESPMPVPEFLATVKEKMAMLRMDKSFASRYLNEGFSGGEKKRTEILQMAMLEPKIAVLDETDSGTDVDAMRTIAEGINKVKTGILIITHYKRILQYVKPDRVIIIAKGKIVIEGGAEIADKIEEEGYKAFGIDDYEDQKVLEKEV